VGCAARSRQGSAEWVSEQRAVCVLLLSSCLFVSRRRAGVLRIFVRSFPRVARVSGVSRLSLVVDEACERVVLASAPLRSLRMRGLLLLAAAVACDARSLRAVRTGARDPRSDETHGRDRSGSTRLVSYRSGGSSVDRVRVPIDPRHLGGVGLAGGVACSVTHSLVLPLDVIKTRVQTDTALATAGVGAAAAAVLRDAPGRGVLRLAAFFNGLPPTALGYLMQGCAKFGGYELLKQQVFGRMRAAGA